MSKKDGKLEWSKERMLPPPPPLPFREIGITAAILHVRSGSAVPLELPSTDGVKF